MGVSIRESERSLFGAKGLLSKVCARVSVGIMALAWEEEETAGCHARTCAGDVAVGVVVAVVVVVVDPWDLAARCLPVL